MNDINVWGLTEKEIDTTKYSLNATLFALGNGYIGTRGNFEEGLELEEYDGTFINGFYDYYDLSYGEKYKGYPSRSHAMLNVTNGKKIDIYINGELFNVEKGTTKDYIREINFRKGVLTRKLTWISPRGDEISFESERLISFYEKHLLLSKVKITPINFDGSIKIISSINGNVKNITKENDPRIGVEFNGDELRVIKSSIDDNIGKIISRTKSSDLGLVCVMSNRLDCTGECSTSYTEYNELVSHTYDVKAMKNEPIILQKYVLYKTYKYVEDNIEKITSDNLIILLKEVMDNGYKFYKCKQKDYLDEFWYNSDISIDGDDSVQQGVRFNMYHLLQSVGRDGLTNISAKGLTGEGYEGHYFWDTEIYILPFFIYTNPDIAKELVEYRYNLLEAARKRGKEMQYDKGALYPWRTINGEECSAYFPAGTAQYHINADIAYSICKYIEASEDEDFLVEKGVEILVETARLWLEIGQFNDDGKFHICCVTGPDEYTAIVNNNVYTNFMAANNLKNAYEAVIFLKNKYPLKYRELADNLNIDEVEINKFHEAYINIYIPYDEDKKIYPQDDSFFQKPAWDFEKSKGKYPLLMHYHPINIYRAQVCKQADLILLEFILNDLFDDKQKKRDYDYYEKITTHDSSLSTCIFSIMANELGYYHKAYDYFIHSVRTDIDDIHNNTTAGVHTANMAGTWMSIIFGFGGMREEKGMLRFSPHLPEKWTSYSFRISFKGRKILVSVDEKGVEYKLLNGDPIVIYNKEEKLELKR
ncbi:glycosyl hydrolase [Vallitalea longa]|uniref:Glycosyl hydrolase n=1 Tax=Vallitalea longa TaxID=2936439 RepID=A0A9W5YCG9_9FIRM|nr:glycosyl hydrolase family 65 protein [Vallitalea longa]GKX29798.1 glycosyl hydrolase [Vallitalea longa]